MKKDSTEDLFTWASRRRFQIGKLEQQFWDFHHANPHVYDLLVKFARQWHARKANGSIKMLFERVRWEVHLTTSDENFKLCNNHHAFYARLMEDQEPDLRGFFRMRQQRIQSTFGPRNSKLPPGEHVA